MERLRILKNTLKNNLGVEMPEHFDHVLPREVAASLKNLRQRGFRLELVRELGELDGLSPEDRQYIEALESALETAEKEKT